MIKKLCQEYPRDMPRQIKLTYDVLEEWYQFRKE